MPDDESSSARQEAFRYERGLFEQEFERFLTSLETPVAARRQEAIETINRLGAIGRRLRAQAVL